MPGELEYLAIVGRNVGYLVELAESPTPESSLSRDRFHPLVEPVGADRPLPVDPLRSRKLSQAALSVCWARQGWSPDQGQHPGSCPDTARREPWAWLGRRARSPEMGAGAPHQTPRLA